MPPIAKIPAEDRLALSEAALKSNAAWNPSYTPVGVFVGGTSGIGQGVVQAFARRTKGNAHIIIVGRNRAAADAIFSGLPTGTPGASLTREFIKCDVSILRNAKRTAADIRERFPRVNFLVLTTGALALTVKETPEGVMEPLALTYYGRWLFIDGLLPSLRAAYKAGEDGRVLNVLNAGLGKPVDLDDIGLKKAFVGLRKRPNALFQTSTYNDLMVEYFAEHDPELTFIHAIPGVVDTPLMKASPSAFIRYSRFLVNFIVSFRHPTLSIEECGEYQLYALRTAPAGASRTREYGQSLGDLGYAGTKEAAGKLWEHTKQVLRAIS